MGTGRSAGRSIGGIDVDPVFVRPRKQQCERTAKQGVK